MKTIGIFEAKTTLSAICDEVARNLEPVTVTRRGKPLVYIEPIREKPMTIMERRSEYMAKFGAIEVQDDAEFEISERSHELSSLLYKTFG